MRLGDTQQCGHHATNGASDLVAVARCVVICCNVRRIKVGRHPIKEVADGITGEGGVARQKILKDDQLAIL